MQSAHSAHDGGQLKPDTTTAFGQPVNAGPESTSSLELNDEKNVLLPCQPEEREILAGSTKKEEVKDGANPTEEPDPWDDIDHVRPVPKKESSPASCSESTNSSSSSPSGSLKRVRSDSPLSSLFSDDELDEKPPALDQPAPKRARQRREPYIPLWELAPLVFRPDVDDEVIEYEAANGGGDYGFMNDVMDNPTPEPQTPPRSPTPVRAASESVSEQSNAHLRQPRAGASKHVQTRVKVEDDDVIMLEDSPPPPDAPYLRASEIDVKVKVEEFGEKTLKERLRIAGARQFVVEGDLDEKGKDSTVHRLYLSSVFGGQFIGTRPTVAYKKWIEHGYNDIMYIGLKVHPSGPRAAGQPGIWCSLGRWPPRDGQVKDEDHWTQRERNPMSDADIKAKARKEKKTPPNNTGIWRIFAGLGHYRNLYIGQCTLQRMEDLSQAEWLDQLESFRKSWAEHFANYAWGREIRCRVKYRRENNNDEPTLAEFEAAMASDDEFKGVDMYDIMHDFNTGKEHLGVYVVNCVDYDMEFQKRIVPESAAWQVKDERDKAEKARAIAAGEIEDPKEKKRRVKEPKPEPESEPEPKAAKAAPKKTGPKQKPAAPKTTGKGRKKRSDDEDGDGIDAGEYNPRKSKKRAQPIDISDLL
ncbi:hypothetical protein PENSPDRAFT_758301 [Peniophora sp. CONT]|nr:hypothetical protein PENSPDRAFT_758301 [Peniophora sp. CONT]